MALEELLSMYLDVKYQQPQRRVICPVCAYNIEDTPRGLHCVNCGWCEGIPPKFIPRTPDQPR